MKPTISSTEPVPFIAGWPFSEDVTDFSPGGCHARDGSEGFGLEISTYVASSACIDGDHAYVGDYDGLFSAMDLKAERVHGALRTRMPTCPLSARLPSGEIMYLSGTGINSCIA